MAPPAGFHTITLGCKLNQFDSAAIEGELDRRGLYPEADRERAEVVVINTCTVTHKADREARRLIRSVRRGNPDCRLIVTGCYAELEADRLRSMVEVDLVFGNREKANIGPLLDRLGVAPVEEPSVGDRGCESTLAGGPALHFAERSRAFLKIQEGCRLACSYCIIPTVRGPSRSIAPGAIENSLRRLVGDGFHEVVLTGVNTGDYGRDLSPAIDLATLLRRLLDAVPGVRIRLNSLEPLTVTDEIVALLAGESRLASHLQVPLQSGSAAILRAMRRNYNLDRYARTVEGLRRSVPGIGLGADVIVGFPGETEARFEETYRFIESSPLNYLHVFAWSPRPGTPASELADRLSVPVIRQRSARLRGLADRLGERFRESMVGRVREAVSLGPDTTGRRHRALTDNFIDVRLDRRAPVDRGALFDLRIDAVEGALTRGAAATGAGDRRRAG